MITKLLHNLIKFLRKTIFRTPINTQNYSEKLTKTINDGRPVIGLYPINVQIQTISTCNGKCIFCPYLGSWHETNPGKMSTDTYNKIIDNLQNFKVQKFCPYLENEPLLDTDLFNKIKYAIERLRPELVELSTNLSALTDPILNEIEDIFPVISHEIWISFHGASKESYEEIMGLDYDKTLENIFKLLDLSQKKPLNIVIRGAGAPKTQKGKLNNYFTSKEYHVFWEDKLKGYKKKPKISFFEYHDRAGAEQLRDKNMSFDSVFRETLNGFYCVRFDRWMHFLYTGEPILCCMDYNKKTAFEQSIKDLTIEELFSSPHFIDLLEKGTGMKSSQKDFICKKCFCPGG